MTKQKRNINTPCCKERIKITWDRGLRTARFNCPNCKAIFRVGFSIDATGKSHKVISKEVV